MNTVYEAVVLQSNEEIHRFWNTYFDSEKASLDTFILDSISSLYRDLIDDYMGTEEFDETYKEVNAVVEKLKRQQFTTELDCDGEDGHKVYLTITLDEGE